MNISTQSLQQLRAAIATLTAALDTLQSAPPPVRREPDPDPFWPRLCDVYLHPECITVDVPEGFDTVLGFLAKNHPEALECFDYTDPTTTQRDGWWLSHRFTPRCYVPAPPVLQERGIEHVRAYPVDLLQKRWGS